MEKKENNKETHHDRNADRTHETEQAFGGRGKGEKELNRDVPMAGVGNNTGDRLHTPGAAVTQRRHDERRDFPLPAGAQRGDKGSQI